MNLARKLEVKVYAYLLNEKTGERHNLDLKSFSIGRIAGNLILSDDKKVSRQHATFHFKDGKAYVEDLGATNPVAIDGAKLNSKEKIQLQSGCILTIGYGTYKFVIEESAELDLGEYTSPDDESGGTGKTLIAKAPDFNDRSATFETAVADDAPKEAKAPAPARKATSRGPQGLKVVTGGGSKSSAPAPSSSRKIEKFHDQEEDFHQYDNATFVQRLLASVVDGVLSGVIFQVVLAGLTFVVTKALPQSAMAILGSTVIGVFGTYYLYFVKPIHENGQTFGKKVMKIKILSTDSEDISKLKVCAREFIAKPTLAGFWFISLPLYLMNKEKLTLWDSMCKTKVVSMK